MTFTGFRISKQWLVLGAVLLGTFICVLNNSLINLGMTTLMHSFHVSEIEVQWVLTGYILTFGVVVPVSGYLAETLGIKKLFTYALGVFLVGSTVGSIAWSFPIVVLARVIQALGAGMIMPTSMTIIYKVVPPGGRGMAMGIWGISVMVAPTIGPVLSGVIVEYLSWRYLFIINIPLVLLAIFVAWRLLVDIPARGEWAFDAKGFITVTLGCFALLYAVNQGNRLGWNSPWIVGLLVFAVVTLLLFIVIETRSLDPLLDFHVFASRDFTLGVIISSLAMISIYSTAYLIPFYLQGILGFSPSHAGLLLIPQAACQGIMMLVSGRVLDVKGPREIVTAGLLVFAAGAFCISRISLGGTMVILLIGLSLLGMGNGMSSMTSTNAGLNSLPDRSISQASAMVNSLRQIAGSIGLVVITAVYEFRLDAYLGGTALPEALSPVYNQAAVNAVGDVFGILGLMMLCGVPLAILLRQQPLRREKKVELG